MSDIIEPEPVDPRILFAAERTLLAYVRTGLALMGFGLVVARFGLFIRQIASVVGTNNDKASPTGFSTIIGISLVVCGIVACTASPIWYTRVIARLERGEPYSPPRYGVATVLAFVLAGIGILITAYLLFSG